jgi:serine protease Do
MSEPDSMHPRSLSPRRPLIAGAVALALAAGGVALAQIQSPPMAGPPGLGKDAAAHAPSVMPSFADVAERVAPAVVNVTTVSSPTAPVLPRGHQGIPQDGPRAELFKRFFEQPGLTVPHRTQAAGSGFLIDPDGHIVTNHHVVDGASEVTVTLSDGTRLKAQVLGRDDKTDLALLKVDAGRTLPYVELGDSAGTRVGDWVLAVGNPFGLGGSVNAGIVSARGRDINSGPYDDYLQIDAPINRGHSGGPLFDVHGRVIGVNTAIYSPTGGNVGIGFAIPVETVRAVTADLRAHGRVERGWLGVQIQPVTEALAAGLGLSGTQGVLIADVLPETPAAGSELRAGDVILQANGQAIQDYKDLPKIVAATKAGTPMRLEVMRSGQPLSLTVSIGRMPARSPSPRTSPRPSRSRARPVSASISHR